MIREINNHIDYSFPVDNNVYSKFLYTLVSQLLMTYIGPKSEFTYNLIQIKQ